MNKFCFEFLSQKCVENKDFSVISSNEVIKQSVAMYMAKPRKKDQAKFFKWLKYLLKSQE